MRRPATIDPPGADGFPGHDRASGHDQLSRHDSLLGRLDRIAADVIAVREAVHALEPRRFDDLRAWTDLLLGEVGRCLARELGPPILAGPGAPDAPVRREGRARPHRSA